MKKIILLIVFVLSYVSFGMDFDKLEHKKISHKHFKLNTNDANTQNKAEYNHMIQQHRKVISKMLPPAQGSGSQKDMCLGKWEKSWCYSSTLNRSQKDMCLGKWEKSWCYSSTLNKSQKDMCLGNWQKSWCYSSALNKSQKNMCLGNWQKSWCYSSDL